MTPVVRGFGPDDWPWILALNAENEVETSRLTEADMPKMSWESCLMLACEQEAFLIVYDQDSNYDSPNFIWFRERYPEFAYVDRIVVAEKARGRGWARALYETLFEEVRATPGLTRVVCEVNIDPPNPGSDAFHARMGFEEVGQATLANGKTVRYLKREL